MVLDENLFLDPLLFTHRHHESNLMMTFASKFVYSSVVSVYFSRSFLRLSHLHPSGFSVHGYE